MTLNTFFPEQIDELKKFTFSSDEVVRCLRLDPEMESVLQKVLLSLDEDPEFPHALIQCNGSFENPTAYFEYLFEILRQEYEKNSEQLKEKGMVFKPVNEATNNKEELEIVSFRKNSVPGTHSIQYDSEIDSLEIRHTAHSRKGFTLGAILAAEWLIGRKGCFSMKDMLYEAE